MTRTEYYTRIGQILLGTTACPVRIAHESFNMDWRDGPDGAVLRALTGVVRCPTCLQWVNVEHVNCRVRKPL